MMDAPRVDKNDFGETEVAPGRPGPLARLAGPAVWLVWALCVAIAAVNIRHRGQVLPWSDDWNIAPVIAGAQPLTGEWLWQQHNEHRIPLAKLLWVVLGRASGGNFGWPIFVNLAALAAAAALLILTVRKLRGHTSLLDAFFPLALLHLGQGGLDLGFQFQFVSATGLVCVLLAVLLRAGPTLAMSQATIAGLCLCLLPVCGGNGLLYVPVLATWLAIRGFSQWRSSLAPAERKPGLMLIGSALAAVALAGLYFVHYQSIAHPWGPAGVAGTLKTSIRVLASAFGPYVHPFWPWSGIATVAFVLGGLACAGLHAVRRWDEVHRRIRALDLAAFLLAILLVTAGVGYGRGGRAWEAGLYVHLASLALPAMVAAWLAFLFAAPRLRLVAQLVPLLVLVFFHGVYVRQRLPNPTNDTWEAQRVAMQADFRAGVSGEIIADRYIAHLFYVDSPEARALIVGGIRDFRRAGFARFGPADAP